MKAKKLTEEELKSLQENVGKLNQAHIELGRLENQKHKILHQMRDVEKKFDDLQKEFEDKYGKVSVNIDNGDISEITEKNE